MLALAIVSVSRRGLAAPLPAAALGLLVLTAAAALAAIRLHRYVPRAGWVFAAADVLPAVLLFADELVHDRPYTAWNVTPAAFVGMAVVAFNALRFRPAIVMTSAGLYIAGVALLVSVQGVGDSLGVTDDAAGGGVPLRWFLVSGLAQTSFYALIALTLVLGAIRSRRLLLRALAEGQERRLFTQFLPAPVAAEISRADSDLRRGVTRDCVVMFVDMRGSTGLAEALDPHRVAAVIGRFRGLVLPVVEAHGGVVEKFIGDGALVVFGVPREAPDDAQRALACAREIAAKGADWEAEGNDGVPVVIGLHAGPCFCGVVGDEERMEFTVLGDPVNVASRLEAMAKADGHRLVVSREVLARAGAEAAPCWRALGPQDIRGRDAAIEVCALHP